MTSYPTLDHYEENDYKDSMNDEFPPNEVQAYTWPDASFREIVGLLQGICLFMITLCLIFSFLMRMYF